MMLLRTFVLSLLLIGTLTLLSSGQEKIPPKDGEAKNPPPKLEPRLIKLAPQSEKPPVRALAYSLLLDPLDQVRGNAAVLWTRAGLEYRGVRFKWTEDHWKWDGPSETALNKLPRKQIRDVLQKYAVAVNLADEAALRIRCDWEQPDYTIGTFSTLLPLEAIQSHREIARMFSLRCRVELAEKDYPAAIRSIRNGLKLGRDVGNSDLLIQDLVGVAIVSIMLGRVEEWMEIPGSPDLYWSLTELPTDLITIQKSVRYELGTVHRSFPQFREFKNKKLTATQAKVLFQDMLDNIQKAADSEMPAWAKGLVPTAMALAYYPGAKKAMIARGRPAKEVEAMPATQVVVMNFIEEYEQTRDEVLKWLTVPSWQAYPELEKVMIREQRRAKDSGNPLIAMLIPAIFKSYVAEARLKWNIATLRAGEALRHHIRVKGKPPEKWSDLAVPGPINPTTGKGYDSYYKLTKTEAILEVPAPMGMSPLIGRRFVYKLATK